MKRPAAISLRDRPHVAGEREDVHHLDFARAVNGQGPVWLQHLRREAMARFESLGLPTRRSEDWRYTNLAPLSKAAYLPAEAVPAASGVEGDIRIVNGRVDGILRAHGLAATTLDSADPGLAEHLLRPEDHALMALNTALAADAVVLSAGRGQRIEQPLVIDYASLAGDERSVHPLVTVRLEEGASLTVIERFTGAAEAAYWVNPVRRVSVGSNAHLRWVTLLEDSPQAIHTGALAVSVGSAGRFDGWSLVSGGRTVRHEIRVAFQGEGGEASLKGATLGGAGQNLAVYTAIDHALPHCRSDQIFRSVVDAGGASAFQGRILVREGAQKTDANQSSRNLLLDRSAEANSKPELEIYADDVKCSHGATVGELDEDALFYLESRGIDAATARAMLVEAFVAGVIEDAPQVADRLRDQLSDWMRVRGEKL